MPHLFPPLESLRPPVPVVESPTEWVGLLGVETLRSARPAKGWTPPPLEAATAVPIPLDLDALRARAEEEGFCAGYLKGQRAGVERGLAEGRRAGHDEGFAEAKQETLDAEAAGLHAFRESLADVVGEVGPAVERWQETVETRAAELAMDAVRALLAAELATGGHDALAIVREALGYAEGAVRAVVRLSPFDRAALAERKEEILGACAGLRDMELVDDRSITGGCIVETEQGVVDATLATRLELMEAA